MMAFVTGGAGFIGSHLVDALLSRGDGVVVYDNFSTGNGGNLPAWLNPIFGDVLDLAALTAAMRGCDFVFHFQANADVRGGRENTRIDLEQNTIATWNVLEAMRANDIANIVFSSSAAVYGEPEEFPTRESYAANQTSLYGASKLSCESMIQAYSEYFGFRHLIFRFVSWVGERYSHGVVVDFINKLRIDSSMLQVLGDGRQRKSYLYVKDGVNAIMRAVDSNAQGIYNLGHDDYMNVVDVAGIVCELMGAKARLEFLGGPRGWVGDSPFVHLDTTKIKRLGWTPETPIAEGIRRTVNHLLIYA